MTQPDDLAAQAGRDPAAFGLLYDQYYRRIYAYLRYRLDDDAAAEDLCAVVFERLLVHIHRYDPERGPFEPWLFSIARNALTDHYRRMRLRRWVPLDALWKQPAGGEDPAHSAERSEELDAVRAAMSALDERQRDLVSLKFGAGLTNRQIAAATGLTESNVGVLLFRAVRKLRGQLIPTPISDMHITEVDHERA